MASDTEQLHTIVLFDGVCNFCNWSVNFIIRHDRHDFFRFAPLQSEAGKALQQRYNLKSNRLDTLIVIESGRAYLRSTAVLRIVRRKRPPVTEQTI